MKIVYVIILAVFLFAVQNAFGKLYVLENDVNNPYSYKTYVIHKNVDEDIEVFRELLDALDNAKKGDIIFIELRHNNGGYITTMQEITKHMKNSLALVITKPTGYTASAAAYLTMQSDFVVMPHTTQMMWHTGSVCFMFTNQCFRTSPSNPLTWVPYLLRIQQMEYLHQQYFIMLPGGYKIEDPFRKPYVTEEEWKILTSGWDLWKTGKAVCDGQETIANRLLDAFKSVLRSTGEHPAVKDDECLIRGTKR